MRLLPVNGEGQKQNFLPGVAVSARAVTPLLQERKCRPEWLQKDKLRGGGRAGGQRGPRRLHPGWQLTTGRRLSARDGRPPQPCGSCAHTRPCVVSRLCFNFVVRPRRS